MGKKNRSDACEERVFWGEQKEISYAKKEKRIVGNAKKKEKMEKAEERGHERRI